MMGELQVANIVCVALQEKQQYLKLT